MYKFFLGLIAAVCMSATAQAGTITSFPLITSGAFDNPGDGNKTYAYRFESDTDWTNADLRIELTSGALVNHLEVPAFGSPFAVPQPAAPFVGDTAIFSPIDAVGDFNSAFPSSVSVANPDPYADSDELSTSWNVSWFNTSTSDIGNFDIAMITLTPDANGTISWRTISGELVEEGGFTIDQADTYVIVNGAIQRIPEPTTLILAGFGLCGVLALRRRS